MTTLDDFQKAVPRQPGVDRELMSGDTKIPSLDLLVVVLNDRDKAIDLRTSAASTILRHYAARAPGLLIAVLNSENEDPDVLIPLIEALPIGRNAKISYAIEALLHHPDKRVVVAARTKMASVD